MIPFVFLLVGGAVVVAVPASVDQFNATVPEVLAKAKIQRYAPQLAECPAQLLREASGLSMQESEWIEGRKDVVKPLVIDWLANSNLSDFDESQYADSHINIALAFSGGGYRAMLSGAGAMAALDSRTPGSTDPGHLGGLLQASTYVSGLSGGSWLLSSVVANHWTSVTDLHHSSDLWQLSNPMMSPYNSTGANLAFFARLYAQVQSKVSAGFDISMTDIYGRALSQQLYGESVRDNTWSSVRYYPEFSQYQMPFPIMIADGVASHTSRVDDTSVVYEFNPFEMGSWDQELNKFTDMQYLGSSVIRGVPSKCYTNFDNIGFLSGTSSTIFNGITSEQVQNSTALGPLINSTQERLSKAKTNKANGPADWQVSSFRPNPFYDPTGNSVVNQMKLSIADGGEDGQNIPLAPFVESSRKVDVVFAFDNSADTQGPTNGGYPNGNAMVMVANRKNSKYGSNYAFPEVPNPSEFLKRGLTSRPTFFGCDGTAVNDDGQPAPLIVYIANIRRSYDANVSTLKLVYAPNEVNGIIQNGYNVVTGNNGTISSDWRSCLACAVVLRENQRQGVTPTDQCSACYEKYCWNPRGVNARKGASGHK